MIPPEISYSNLHAYEKIGIHRHEMQKTQTDNKAYYIFILDNIIIGT
jgi:hypothetical protein